MALFATLGQQCRLTDGLRVTNCSVEGNFHGTSPPGRLLLPPPVVITLHPQPAPQSSQSPPAEDHQGLAVVLAAAQVLGIGLQHSKPQLEDGSDPVVEEAIDDVHCALQRHDAEEQSQEPGERDGRQGRGAVQVLRQLGEVLPDQLLEHGLVHLGPWTRKATWWEGLTLQSQPEIGTALRSQKSEQNLSRKDSH